MLKSNKLFNQKKFLVIFFVLSVLLAVDSTYSLSEKDMVSNKQDEIVRDYWPTHGWKTSTPQEQNVNSTELNIMYSYIKSNSLALHGLVIIRKGYIIYEKYPDPNYDVNSSHHIWSSTKSYMSALIGIGIEEGYISSVEEKVIDFFPDNKIENLDAWKEEMTLKHLLSMTSGITWDEWSYFYGDSRNSITQMLSSGNILQHFLNLPMEYEPGSVWEYCSGGPHLMSYIIYKTTGLFPLDFANQYMFEPLGLTNVQWGKDRLGIHDGQGGLFFTPRDMARFGYLFLNNGTWNGTQLISHEWIRNSTRTITNFDPPLLDEVRNGYGYLWWTLPDYGVYYSAGMGGQYMFIDPARDLIAVFTAGIINKEVPWCKLFCNYLIPAVLEDVSTSPTGTFNGISPYSGFFETFVAIAIVYVGYRKH